MRIVIILFLNILLYSCGFANTTSGSASPTLTDEIATVDSVRPVGQGETLVLTQDVDLKGAYYELPKGVTIEAKGGCFKNGTVKGNQTVVIGDTVLFDDVHIEGTWMVRSISTDMFRNLDYPNSLRDVMALTNPAVDNEVHIKAGLYLFSFKKNLETGLLVGSNTTVIVDGILMLEGNKFTNYHIIEANGTNITICGNGTVYGDRTTHTGTAGEWGMGIDVTHSDIVLIKDLTVLDCWGDCIYVGDSSKNVVIENCKLRNSRRQGISVTYGSGVEIRNCEISNIYGTAPQFGIDLEPNKGGVVENVTITGNYIFNCYGGILVYGKAEDAGVKNVTISNNHISYCEYEIPLCLVGADNVMATDNVFESHKESRIGVTDVHQISINYNKIRLNNKYPLSINQSSKKESKGNIIE